jgi:hypothetical protein
MSAPPSGACSTSAMRFLYFLSRPVSFLGADFIRPPHPPIQYCIPILKRFEVTQKRASPLGKERVNQANMMGIIQSIRLLCVFWLGSTVGACTIFCCTHIEAPTSSARNISPVAKFSQRKWLFRGSVE